MAKLKGKQIAEKSITLDKLSPEIQNKISTFIHRQLTSSAIWNIQHNLNDYPSVTVIDSAGSVVIGEVTYNSVNDLTITFSAPFSGTAYLN